MDAISVAKNGTIFEQKFKIKKKLFTSFKRDKLNYGDQIYVVE